MKTNSSILLTSVINLPKLLAAFYFYKILVLVNLKEINSFIYNKGENNLSVISTSLPLALKLLKEIHYKLPPLAMKLLKPLLILLIAFIHKLLIFTSGNPEISKNLILVNLPKT